jgi:hypothetical protein
MSGPKARQYKIETSTDGKTTGWPHRGSSALGIMEFTVFGKPAK